MSVSIRRVSRSLSFPALRCLRTICLALMVCLGAAGAAADEPTFEFWPETDLWLRLSPEWRLSLFVPLSQNIETHYREGSLIAQADYAWGKTTMLHKVRLLDENRAQQMKALLIRGGYLAGRSLDDHGATYRERTVLVELHARTPLVHSVLLSSRLRTDLRWLGDPAEFSYRWRLRLMMEKEFEAGRASIVPYLKVEPYYDSRYETVNRVRMGGGTSVAWSQRFALEGELTYQHDSRSSVTNLFALGVILHVYFERGGAR